MQIAETHSHLNGEEYLMVHKKNILQEIEKTIKSINAENFRNKISREQTMKGKKLYSPTDLNNEFKKIFGDKGWQEGRYYYYVSTDFSTVDKIKTMETKQQKKYLI